MGDDPAKALDRLLEISDPAVRRRTFDDAFFKLFRGPIDLGNGAWQREGSETGRTAAQEWLEQARLPEEWKQTWR